MEMAKIQSNFDERKIYRIPNSEVSLEFGSCTSCQGILSTTKGKILLVTLIFIIAAGTFIGGYFVGQEYDIFPSSKVESWKATSDSLTLTSNLVPFTPSSSISQEINYTSTLINVTYTETPTTVAIISTNLPTSRKTSTESIQTIPTTAKIPFTTPRTKWTNVDCSIPQENTCTKSSLPLLLISLDGFREDYLKMNLTPSIQHLLNCGVSSYMRPVYPTVTFPNHYTIVTGLYPESHGIVDNNIYDPDLKKFFALSNKEIYNPEWWFGEPIWYTVQKSGKKSAVYFWPGSDVNISGMQPNVWSYYNHSTPFTNRVQRVLGWLNQSGEDQKDFIAVYFHEPDSAGHKVGPYNKTLLPEILEEVDNTIDELMQGIFDLGLLKCVNIILVADHGMEEISCNRREVMEHYNLTSADYFIYQGPNARIELKNKTQSVEDVLEKIECKSPNFNVFKKEDYPKRSHYAKSKRISPILISVKSKWIVTRKETSYFCDGGAHGYDNFYDSMNALFGAYGPAFKEDYKAEPFNIFELYNLMAEILNSKPAPNNGTHGSLHYLLRHAQSPPEKQQIFDYDKCERPTDESIIEDFQAEASCFGEEIDKGSTRPQRSVTIPWNTPASTMNTSLCLLVNMDFSTGFSKILKYPVWVAYQLSGEKEIVNVTTNSEMKTNPDLRMDYYSLPRCSLFGSEELNLQKMTKGFLFPLEYSIHDGEGNTALIASNLVLFYINFAQGLWREIHLYIQKWRNHLNSIQVISGPIFDHNMDGLPDESHSIPLVNELPLATHYFIVVTKCLQQEKDVSECQPQFLDVIAFILPHRSESPCMGIEEYLIVHSAHVRDVELITGLQLFSSLPIYDAIRLRVKFPGTLNKFLEK